MFKNATNLLPIFSQCSIVLVCYWFYFHIFSCRMYRIWFSNIHTKMYQVHKDLTTTKKSFKADSNRYGEGVAGGFPSIYTIVSNYCIDTCIYICISVYHGCPNKLCRKWLKFKLLESVRNGAPRSTAPGPRCPSVRLVIYMKKNCIDYHNVSHKIFHNKLTFVARQAEGAGWLKAEILFFWLLCQVSAIKDDDGGLLNTVYSLQF